MIGFSNPLICSLYNILIVYLIFLQGIEAAANNKLIDDINEYDLEMVMEYNTAIKLNHLLNKLA